MNYIDEFEHILEGDDGTETTVIVAVVNYERYRPAMLSGAPENCMEAEGGIGDWVLLDPATRKELDRQASPSDVALIDDIIFRRMEHKE